MSDRRSARVEVRNPVLALPAAAQIRRLPLAQRRPLGRLLRELAEDADRRAEAAWSRRKGVMAAYWRAVSTYAKHLARALDPERASGSAETRDLARRCCERVCAYKGEAACWRLDEERGAAWTACEVCDAVAPWVRGLLGAGGETRNV